MLARAHGEDGALNEGIEIPAKHLRAALDDLARAAGGKLFVLVLLLDGLDLKVVHALARAHEGDRADEAGQLVGGKEHLFHLMHGLHVGAQAIAMRTDGVNHVLAHAGGAQQLRGFPAVLLGPVFKVDIVQKTHGGPVIGVGAVAQLVGIPAHHALHGQRVLDVKGLLVIGFEQREGLLAGQVALHGTFLLGSCALNALWLSYHPRPGRSSPHGFFAGMA